MFLKVAIDKLESKYARQRLGSCIFFLFFFWNPVYCPLLPIQHIRHDYIRAMRLHGKAAYI
jgi:hypothetical protein